MTSSIAASLAGSESFSPSGALNTRFTEAAFAGFPPSGNSSMVRWVASIAGVPEIENSDVIGFISAAAAPPTPASNSTHAMMTFHLLRYDQRPTRKRNLATVTNYLQPDNRKQPKKTRARLEPLV